MIFRDQKFVSTKTFVRFFRHHYHHGDCRDVVRYWQTLDQDWDADFGSRFMHGGGVIDYSRHCSCSCCSAFYRRTVIEGCRPFLSSHFNLTELRLQTIVRTAAPGD